MTPAQARRSFGLPIFLAVATLSGPRLISAEEAIETRQVAVGASQRMIVHSAAVPAPIESVWEALSTAEGWQSWAVPFAHMDELRPGAVIETSYNPHARRGDPANIHNTVTAYLPLQMLVIAATNAPPDFPDRELLADLATVIELERAAPDRTLVRLSMVGYGAEERYDRLFQFFTQGNGWTLQRLLERFEKGPVDWAAQRPSPGP